MNKTQTLAEFDTAANVRYSVEVAGNHVTLPFVATRRSYAAVGATEVVAEVGAQGSVYKERKEELCKKRARSLVFSRERGSNVLCFPFPLRRYLYRIENILA